MANREACELYIEQQIEEALEDGKTPYSIGKELSAMIERIFETKMPPKTLESRASRHKAKLTSNEVNGPSAGNDEEKACNDCNKTEKKDVVAAGGLYHRRPPAPVSPKRESATIIFGSSGA